MTHYSPFLRLAHAIDQGEADAFDEQLYYEREESSAYITWKEGEPYDTFEEARDAWHKAAVEWRKDAIESWSWTYEGHIDYLNTLEEERQTD